MITTINLILKHFLIVIACLCMCLCIHEFYEARGHQTSGVTSGGDPLTWCWELNLRPLPEQ